MVMFMEAQEYDIKRNIIFQDNQSTISMLNNRRDFCTGKSRHIHIRHFFVKNTVYTGEIEVNYFPTHLIIADYFTKPLQRKMLIFL